MTRENRYLFTAERGRLVRMMMRAVGRMETLSATEGDLAQGREAALFDPECGQWHFVSLDGMVG